MHEKKKKIVKYCFIRIIISDCTLGTNYSYIMHGDSTCINKEYNMNNKVI